MKERQKYGGRERVRERGGGEIEKDTGRERNGGMVRWRERERGGRL